MNSGLKFALLFLIAATARGQGVWERLADYEIFEVSAPQQWARSMLP